MILFERGGVGGGTMNIIFFSIIHFFTTHAKYHVLQQVLAAMFQWYTHLGAKCQSPPGTI